MCGMLPLDCDKNLFALDSDCIKLDKHYSTPVLTTFSVVHTAKNNPFLYRHNYTEACHSDCVLGIYYEEQKELNMET